jgi:UDP-N-acetylglucosamine acyltransferase
MIHPSALVDPGAKLDRDVRVGAFSFIGPGVEVGEGTEIGHHAVLEGRTRIGRHNRIGHFVSIGGAPQDKKYAGEDTEVRIGEGNTIREYVTINRGTAQDGGVTRMGDDNWIMAYVHLAHDCQVGNHTIFANNAALAGHVRVDDWVVLGGYTMVHQFVRIGAHAFTGMATYLDRDLPPYVRAAGQMARPYGLNATGLRRRGFGPEALAGLKRAYRALYRSGLSLEEARRAIDELAGQVPQVGVLARFLGEPGRGIIR